jgi:pseudouridylate synthase / pseudouridine kinase
MHLLPPEAQTTGWSASSVRTSGRQIVVKSTNGSILVLKYFPALPLESSGFDGINAVNVTGAGDSLVGSLLASVVSNGPEPQNPFLDPQQLDAAMARAQKAAILTLHSSLAVSPLLSSG